MSDNTFASKGGETSGRGPDDYDRLFDVLSAHRRRIVLRHLADVRVASVGELADRLVARGVDDPDATIALRHGDLPRLRDARLVEYDPRSETARYDGDPLVEELLSRTRAGNRRA
ncbi:hypothetical protein [Saliphagus sp. LR7]|uniref:DUF7344 domain-containing protein n=1 Tax=Saliphagus sp. LR7 TaxID=2282654 RepID=UPI000DF77217|nr:hypothetical protein [Saliphagus sp. LR7]